MNEQLKAKMEELWLISDALNSTNAVRGAQVKTWVREVRSLLAAEQPKVTLTEEQIEKQFDAWWRTTLFELGTSKGEIARKAWHAALLQAEPAPLTGQQCSLCHGTGRMPGYIDVAEPAPQYRRTDKCDEVRHQMGYELCLGCEQIEPAPSQSPECTGCYLDERNDLVISPACEKHGEPAPSQPPAIGPNVYRDPDTGRESILGTTGGQSFTADTCYHGVPMNEKCPRCAGILVQPPAVVEVVGPCRHEAYHGFSPHHCPECRKELHLNAQPPATKMLTPSKRIADELSPEGDEEPPAPEPGPCVTYRKSELDAMLAKVQAEAEAKGMKKAAKMCEENFQNLSAARIRAAIPPQGQTVVSKSMEKRLKAQGAKGQPAGKETKK